MTTETNPRTRADLHTLVDALPDTELPEAQRLLMGLNTTDPALRTALLAPIDDEPLTDEDIAAIEEAKQQLARGEYVSDEELGALLGDREEMGTSGTACVRAPSRWIAFPATYPSEAAQGHSPESTCHTHFDQSSRP